ncbi:hypothetical protein BAUCODRAFT_29941 [Baudoinia panamericana UAMH 10762]|uniref:Phosphoglycerate mutase-like protein n=1 Tax=Baudoinia panamericana (strain UAMH 10762) TaxID=717646 RepID=M2N691_BAUPA|nr:uncharacterized protein BAUCODRAFT_29941 [Baudoinia panamericana UAMH 10762]EMC99568.1 hypothetical protein BAUCODRAFT_29941 [Baudoinia panamericana UAMH 10762]
MPHPHSHPHPPPPPSKRTTTLHLLRFAHWQLTETYLRLQARLRRYTFVTITTTTNMPPTLHLVRHAQGYHNLNIANHRLHDPQLTPYGEQQCEELHKSFPHHAAIEAVIASPLKRTINTALLSFSSTISSKNLRVIALPELQETSDLPCDTGSSPSELLHAYADKPVDLSLVTEGWNSKKGKRAPNAKAIEARARAARRWLRGRGENEIVVVTHG